MPRRLPPPSTAPPPSPLPRQIGEQFVSKYYEVLEKHPRYLGRFYKEHSTFSVVDVGHDGADRAETAQGSLEVSLGSG